MLAATIPPPVQAMTPEHSSPVPGRVGSGSPVHVAGITRITPSDAIAAYRLVRCGVGFDERLEVDGRTGSAVRACPLDAAAIAGGTPPRSLLGLDAIATGDRLGLEPAYVAGHLDGWFGFAPAFPDDPDYRLGWRDGAATYAELRAESPPGR